MPQILRKTQDIFLKEKEVQIINLNNLELEKIGGKDLHKKFGISKVVSSRNKHAKKKNYKRLYCTYCPSSFNCNRSFNNEKCFFMHLNNLESKLSNYLIFKTTDKVNEDYRLELTKKLNELCKLITIKNENTNELKLKKSKFKKPNNLVDFIDLENDEIEVILSLENEEINDKQDVDKIDQLIKQNNQTSEDIYLCTENEKNISETKDNLQMKKSNNLNDVENKEVVLINIDDDFELTEKKSDNHKCIKYNELKKTYNKVLVEPNKDKLENNSQEIDIYTQSFINRVFLIDHDSYTLKISDKENLNKDDFNSDTKEDFLKTNFDKSLNQFNSENKLDLNKNQTLNNESNDQNNIDQNKQLVKIDLSPKKRSFSTRCLDDCLKTNDNTINLDINVEQQEAFIFDLTKFTIKKEKIWNDDLNFLENSSNFNKLIKKS